MPRELRNSVITITGASAGIGKALAEVLHRRGARLVLAARRIDKLEALNRTLGGEHLCLQVDVSRSDDCRMMIEETIARFGRIDTLVCNAGYGLVRRVHEMTELELQQIIQTNVIGTTEPIRHAVPHLKKNDRVDGWRGQIVIVSSAAAWRSLPFFGAYSATKAMQLSLAESLRVELANSKIAVTSVHPVGTTSEFLQAAEELSAAKIDVPGRSTVKQTSERVAADMVRAMVNPRPEVWPFWPVILPLTLAKLWPSFADWVMRQSLRDIEAAQRAERSRRGAQG